MLVGKSNNHYSEMDFVAIIDPLLSHLQPYTITMLYFVNRSLYFHLTTRLGYVDERPVEGSPNERLNVSIMINSEEACSSVLWNNLNSVRYNLLGFVKTAVAYNRVDVIDRLLYYLLIGVIQDIENYVPTASNTRMLLSFYTHDDVYRQYWVPYRDLIKKETRTKVVSKFSTLITELMNCTTNTKMMNRIIELTGLTHHLVSEECNKTAITSLIPSLKDGDLLYALTVTNDDGLFDLIIHRVRFPLVGDKEGWDTIRKSLLVARANGNTHITNGIHRAITAQIESMLGI